MTSRRLHRNRLLVVLACAVIGVVVGFAIGASIAAPGAFHPWGEGMSGGPRRVMFTGLITSVPGLLIGLLVGIVTALLLRGRRGAAPVSTSSDDV